MSNELAPTDPISPLTVALAASPAPPAIAMVSPVQFAKLRAMAVQAASLQYYGERAPWWMKDLRVVTVALLRNKMCSVLSKETDDLLLVPVHLTESIPCAWRCGLFDENCELNLANWTKECANPMTPKEAEWCWRDAKRYAESQLETKAYYAARAGKRAWRGGHGTQKRGRVTASGVAGGRRQGGGGVNMA